MPSVLDIETVRQRLIALPRDDYLQVGGLMRGVTLAAATVVLLETLSPTHSASRWPLLFAWATSFVIVILTYTAWARGTLLANSRGNVGDILWPLLVGVAEFSLFAVLSPKIVDPDIWGAWLLVLSCHALFAAALVQNRICCTHVASDFSADLQELADRYLFWLRRDRFACLVAGCAAFVGWLFFSQVVHPCVSGDVYMKFYGVVVGVLGFVFARVVCQHNAHRREIDAFAFRLVPTSVDGVVNSLHRADINLPPK